MSGPSRSEYIDNEVDYVTDNYETAGCFRVERAEDIGAPPYVHRYMLSVLKDGCDEPDADVIVHLKHKRADNLACSIYLWNKQLWSGTCSGGQPTEQRWMLMVSLLGGIDG